MPERIEEGQGARERNHRAEGHSAFDKPSQLGGRQLQEQLPILESRAHPERQADDAAALVPRSVGRKDVQALAQWLHGGQHEARPNGGRRNDVQRAGKLWNEAGRCGFVLVSRCASWIRLGCSAEGAGLDGERVGAERNAEAYWC